MVLCLIISLKIETENGFRMSSSSHINEFFSRFNFSLSYYVYIIVYTVAIVVAVVIFNYGECPIKHPELIQAPSPNKCLSLAQNDLIRAQVQKSPQV